MANVRAAMRHRAAFEAKEMQRTAPGASAVLGSSTPFSWFSNFSRHLLKGEMDSDAFSICVLSVSLTQKLVRL